MYIDYRVRVTHIMNIMYSLHLLHVSADLHGHHQVVVQIHNKNGILAIGLPFTQIFTVLWYSDTVFDIDLTNTTG
jgi:hypothetical protein